jgi:acyl carrier protein
MAVINNDVESTRNGELTLNILARLCEVFQEVFDDDDLVVTRDTSAREVGEWDSLMHINLVLNVEKEFSVRFSSSEVAVLQNVGQLVDLIDAKRNNG